MGDTDIIYVVTETDKSKYDAEEIVPDPEFKKKTTKKNTKTPFPLYILNSLKHLSYVWLFFIVVQLPFRKKRAYLKLDEFS